MTMYLVGLSLPPRNQKLGEESFVIFYDQSVMPSAKIGNNETELHGLCSRETIVHM